MSNDTPAAIESALIASKAIKPRERHRDGFHSPSVIFLPAVGRDETRGEEVELEKYDEQFFGSASNED